MKIKVNKQNVGLRIKQIRLDKGYTLEEFGKLLGDYQANKATVLGWENGRSLPNKERIKAIAKFADITVNELLYGSVEEFIRENYKIKKIRVGNASDELLEDVSSPAEFYIHYIKENGIDFDINFPEKIIDFIDNQLALKFLKQEFNKLGDILKKTDFTSLRIQMQFSDILDSLNILKRIAEDTAKLEQISTDKLNAFIKESENNINILQEIKIKLETIANNNQDNQ